MKTVFIALVLLSLSSFATEPLFCKLDYFKAKERSINFQGLKRAHEFAFGSFTIVGLAVGESDVNAVKNYSQKFSNKMNAKDKFCTWYYNDNNPDAIEAFVHRYVSNPALKDVTIANEYEQVLAGTFNIESPNMLSCLQRYKYLALGCDGMKHRGPSVFAMLLSYAGCTPQKSVEIANFYWDKNFVSVKTREAIAQKGFELGGKNPKVRLALQNIFSQ